MSGWQWIRGEECVMTAIARPVIANANDVARYLLVLAFDDGDLISNLKMQKLVYFAYAHVLRETGYRLFPEPIQAWANGPVVWELYSQLKRYGRGPIGEDFLAGDVESEFDRLNEVFPPEVIETLNGVYEAYIGKSAFELVTLTHNQLPWQEAREGLAPGEHSTNVLSDEAIMRQFAGA